MITTKAYIRSDKMSTFDNNIIVIWFSWIDGEIAIMLFDSFLADPI